MVMEAFFGLLIIGLLGGIWSRLGKLESQLNEIQAHLTKPPPR